MGKSKTKKAKKKHDQISEVPSSQRPADQDPLRMEKDSDVESSKNSQHTPETESGSSHEGEEGLDQAEGGEGGGDEGVGIDHQLEEAAARRNLSVLNVKSILHHVLKDKGVLALIQKRVAEEEGREVAEEWSESITTYEPKLTRSRVRQAVESSVASGTLSPEKLASLSRPSFQRTPVKSSHTTHEETKHGLLDISFPEEESSDEEYEPLDEGSSEEEEGGEGEEEGEGKRKEEGKEEGEEEGEEKGKKEEEGNGEVEGEGKDIRGINEGAEEGEPCASKQWRNASPDAAMGPALPLSTEPQEPPKPDNECKLSSAANAVGSGDLRSSDIFDIPAVEGTPVTQTPRTSTAFTPATSIDAASANTEPPITSTASIAGQHDSQHATTSVYIPTTTSSTVPSVSQDFPPGSYSVPSMLTRSSQEEEDAIVQEAAALLASLSESLQTPPRPIQPQQFHSTGQMDNYSQSSSSVQNEEEIAKRTRSKYPLTDTSISVIEASFIPPDVEDPPTPMEVDDEELQWQKWLADLMNPSNSPAAVVTEDDQDDMEYNYLADQQEEEREEFRNDRAVKISQKEVADLVDELLNPGDDGLGGLLLSSEGVDLTSAYLLESLGLQPPLLMQGSNQATPQPNEAYRDRSIALPGTSAAGGESGAEEVGYCLSNEQTMQLQTQIQQHFQLLMQTFVLSRFEPSLVFLSQIAAQAVEEITKWSQEAAEGHNSPVWYVPGVAEANELVRKLNPYDQDAVKLIPSTGNPPRVPEPAQDVIMNHHVFWTYPELLPAIGFAPLTSGTSSGGKYFTTDEEYLLVLGMEHYGSSAWKVIQENLLPTKTVKQLQLRVKNQCSKRTGDNVIKHYKKTKKVKIPFKDEEEQRELPLWILNYHKKRVEREKDEEKRREKELEDTRRMAKILDGVLRPPSKAAVLRLRTVGLPVSGNVTSKTEHSCTSGSASKRNLASKLQEAESEAKRVRLEPAENAVIPGKGRGGTSTRAPFRRGGKTARQGSLGSRKTQRTVKYSPAKSPRRPVKPSPVNFVQPHSKARANHSGASPLKKAAQTKRADVEQLFLAAGLEASSPEARYAYNYLTEVKATLMDSEEGTYGKFLNVLLTAKRERWKPSKLYRKVQQVLQPWPHLVKLFTEFLEPEDCLEADALADKYELESVKIFVQKLQGKFGSTPLHLEEIITRLTNLDGPNVTRETVQQSLLPLLEAHDELVEELRRFLYQLAPQPRTDDVYEEVILASDCEKEPDEFEELTLVDSPLGKRASDNVDSAVEGMPPGTKTQHFYSEVHIKSRENTDTGTKPFSSSSALPRSHPEEPSKVDSEHQNSSLDPTQRQSSVEKPHYEIRHYGDGKGVQSHDSRKPQDSSSLEAAILPNAASSTSTDNYKAGTDQSNAEGNFITQRSLDVKEGTNDCRQEEQKPSGWTREEDRVILQTCLQAGTQVSERAFSDVAAQLQRSRDEVEARYHQLFTLFQSTS